MIKLTKLDYYLPIWLYLYLVVLIPIELINGFFLYHGIGFGSSLISFLKFVMVLVGISFVLLTSKEVSKYLIISILIFCSLIIFQTLLGLFEIRTLFIFAKLIFNAIAIYFFYYCIAVSYEYRKIYNVVLLNSLFLILNLLMSYFGFGFDNYKSGDGEGFGGTGYLYAGNEVGAALLASLASLLLIVRTNIKLLLVILLYSIAGLLISSKASLLGIFFAIFILAYYYNRLIFIITLSIFFVLLPVLWSVFSNKFELAINRWLFLIDNYGVEYFILGGAKRVDYIVNTILTNFQNNPILLLVGSGWSGEAENNLFDLFEAFGLFGLAIFVLWCFMILKGLTTLIVRRTSSKVRSSYMIGVMVLFLSLIAGHVMQSSLIAPFLFFIWIGLKGTKINEL